MATTKNITMKQFNGTDYDILYPKTDVNQVENLTPAAIGAVAKTGDTMTGQLSVPAFTLTNYNAALEIGKNIDFHAAGSTNDYDARLTYDSGKLLFKLRVGDYKTILHTGNLSDLKVTRIETGSYVGTGTYGESNKNTLTFSFEPKFLYVYTNTGFKLDTRNSTTNVLYDNLLWAEGISSVEVFTDTNIISRSGKTITWYADYSTSQLNTSGTTYYYVAIG